MSFGFKEIRSTLLIVVLSFIAAAILAEWALGAKVRYERKTTLDYGDMMRRHGLGFGGYLKENLTAYVTNGLGGKVRWTNNALGFRSDREFSRHPRPGVLRILSLGDSFNAGYRVGQHQRFTYLADQWINQKYGKAEILVAETEEPTTALFYLDRFGLKLEPQIVLLGITLGNDIAEAYQGLDPKGGYILAINHGQVHIDRNRGPQIGFHQLMGYKIPPAYLQSESTPEKVMRRIERWTDHRRLLQCFDQQHEAIISWGDQDNPSLFDLCNGFGAFTNPPPPQIKEAYRRLFRILTGFNLICRQHDIIFAVQLFPQRYQVQPGDWHQAVQAYGLKKSRFDLMAPNRRIGEFCRKHDILCIDPTLAMAHWYLRNRTTMYLPCGDMHWNPEGHRVFFECIKPALTKLVREGFKLVQANNPRNTGSAAAIANQARGRVQG